MIKGKVLLPLSPTDTLNLIMTNKILGQRMEVDETREEMEIIE